MKITSKLLSGLSPDFTLSASPTSAGEREAGIDLKVSSIESSLFRSSDNNDLSTVLKFLVDQSYQATASATEKEKARKGLEVEFSAVLGLLEESGADNRLVTKAKALSPSLYNIYKEARQSSRSDISIN